MRIGPLLIFEFQFVLVFLSHALLGFLPQFLVFRILLHPERGPSPAELMQATIMFMRLWWPIHIMVVVLLFVAMYLVGRRVDLTFKFRVVAASLLLGSLIGSMLGMPVEDGIWGRIQGGIPRFNLEIWYMALAIYAPVFFLTSLAAVAMARLKRRAG